jgi:hypothetical protein
LTEYPEVAFLPELGLVADLGRVELEAPLPEPYALAADFLGVTLLEVSVPSNRSKSGMGKTHTLVIGTDTSPYSICWRVVEQ